LRRRQIAVNGTAISPASGQVSVTSGLTATEIE
jgi:hypothetical protein